MLSHIISKNIKMSMYAINFATLSLCHIIHLFSTSSFSYLTFSSPNYLKNKTKSKTFLLRVSPQLLLYFFQLFLSHFASLSLYYSLLYHYTSFIISSFLYFDFSSLHLILYHTKNVSTLSLGGFLFFLIALI